MLGRKFLKVDGVALPTPSTAPKIKMKNIESVMTSEAGTDLVDSIRLQKKTVTCNFQVTSFWKAKLEEIGNETTVSLQIGTATAFTCRPRITGEDLFQDSHTVEGTDGLWTVQMTFEEV